MYRYGHVVTNDRYGHVEPSVRCERVVLDARPSVPNVRDHNAHDPSGDHNDVHDVDSVLLHS